MGLDSPLEGLNSLELGERQYSFCLYAAPLKGEMSLAFSKPPEVIPTSLLTGCLVVGLATKVSLKGYFESCFIVYIFGLFLLVFLILNEALGSLASVLRAPITPS